MPDKIVLTVIRGVLAGKPFVFEHHDILLFGRQKECHICLPDDQMVSRHHFLLEVNPPLARLHDLGSRNGTFVNGVRYGGRPKHETPEQAGQHDYPFVNLQHNDEIRVGGTTLRLEVHAQARAQFAVCQQCGQNIAAAEAQSDLLCTHCRQRLQNEPAVVLFRLLAEVPAHEVQGIRLNDYRIQRKLGEGGMGSVYLIVPKVPEPNREVALKVMSAKTALDAGATQAFLREIESTRALQHANIINFLGSGVVKNIFYFLLEYCQGGSVDDLRQQRGGRLSPAEAGPIMLQALQGLMYAHQNGFVHRDIKPANILLSGNSSAWQTKIADFGLAKSYMNAGLSGMTISGGGFAGSFPFIAREQVVNYKYTGPLSDIWSMGATFYYLLSGKFPRPSQPGLDPIEVILRKKAVPLRQANPQCPPGLASIIDRSLAFYPQDRYRTAGEMLSLLVRELKGLR